MKKHFTHFVSWEYFYGKVYITFSFQRVGKSPHAISTKNIILKVNAEHVNAIISFAMEIFILLNLEINHQVLFNL